MRRQVAFSVIIPLTNGQGEELACVRSWTHGQDFCREHYQVLLATAGDNPEFDRQAEALLGPGDRLVRSGGSIAQLFHDAAQQAEGEILLFSELHCVADPGCLSALHTWFDQNPQMAGACTGVTYSNPTPVAAMVQRVFEQQAAEWFRPGHWRRVLIRGTALRRTAYEAVGGFEGDLNTFADVVLAARLHRQGLQIGWADDARVTHINEPHIEEVLSDGRDYATGEHRFRLRAEAVQWEEYLGLAESWTGARAERREGFGNDLACFVRLLNANPFRNRAALRLMAGRVLAGLIGPRRRRWSLLAALAWARLRFHLPGLLLADQQRAFEDLWNLEIQHELVRLALAEPLGEEEPILLPGACDARQMVAARWTGIYGLEKERGTWFRWTGPAFRLRWQLPVETPFWQIMIECGPACPFPQSRLLGAFWNGRKISAADIQIEDERLRFRVGPAAEKVNELFVVCRPFNPRWHGGDDHRSLGLPIARLDCRPLARNLRLAA